MSDLDAQIGGLVIVSENALEAAAAQQRETAAALNELKAQIKSLAALGPKLVTGVEAGVSAAAKAAVLEASGDLKSVMDQLRATAAGTDKDLAGSVSKFRRAWGLTLIGGLVLFVFAMTVFVVAMGWWDRQEIQSLLARKEALQADVATLQANQTNFERRGRRLIWSTCDGAPCFAIKPIVRTYTTPDGTAYAIPVSAPKP